MRTHGRLYISMKLIVAFILAAAFQPETIGVTTLKISGSPSQVPDLMDWTATSKKQPKLTIKEKK